MKSNQTKNTVNPTEGSKLKKETEQNLRKDAQDLEGSFQPHNIQKEALGPNTRR